MINMADFNASNAANANDTASASNAVNAADVCEFGICEHDEFCGGCIHQGVPYEEQLKLKEDEVRRLFDERGVRPEVFDGIEGCPADHKYRYRNKMEYTFGDLVKDGPTTLGMHKKKNFMSIITVDHCQLVDEDFNKVLRFTLDFANEHGYTHYHKKSHKGLLRHLIVRKGIRTNESAGEHCNIPRGRL